MITKLTDTQTAVLQAAADEPSGRIAWFPTSVKGGARAKVLQGLVARGLAKTVGEGHRLTAADYAAVSCTRPERKKGAPKDPEAAEAHDPPPAPKPARESDASTHPCPTNPQSSPGVVCSR